MFFVPIDSLRLPAQKYQAVRYTRRGPSPLIVRRFVARFFNMIVRLIPPDSANFAIHPESVRLLLLWLNIRWASAAEPLLHVRSPSRR